MEFDFIALKPDGVVPQVQLPISARFDGEARDWVKGVRIFSDLNSIEGEIYSVLHA